MLRLCWNKNCMSYWTYNYRYIYGDSPSFSLSLFYRSIKPSLISETETESKMFTEYRVPKTGCPSFVISSFFRKNVKTKNPFFLILTIRMNFPSTFYHCYLLLLAIEKFIMHSKCKSMVLF